MARQANAHAMSLHARLIAIGTAFMVACALSCAMLAAPAAFADNSAGQGSNKLAVDLIDQDEGYSAVLYDNTSGLPTSEANAIAQTSEGFIWIGSYSGLIRYDGNTFERFDSTTGITSVMSLFVDSQDRLWIGTNDNGAAVMQRGELKFFNKDDGLQSSAIRSIAEDAQGNIYLGSTNGIAIVDANMNLRTLDDPKIDQVYVRQLHCGPDNILYGVSMDYDVFTLKDGALDSFFAPGELPVDDAISILPDPNRAGYVYLGTELSQVYSGRLDNELADAEAIDIAPLAYVKGIEAFGDEIAICADNGIGIVDNSEVHQLENIPLNNSIDHAMADYAGNVWFTSSRQGVMKVVPNQFSDIYERFDLPSAVVNSTCLLDGRLFVTDTGLTVLDDNGAVASLPIERATTASGTDLGAQDLIGLFGKARIRSVIRDSAGRLWFSTYGDLGLVRYDPATATAMCFTSADGMPSDRIRAICERTDGSVIVACTGGAALIEGDAVVKVYGQNDGIANTEILTVCEATNGDILLGSDGDGIYVIGANGTVNISTDQGLASDVVMRVKKDPARELYWIVTSNSIAYMDPEYKVTTVQGFPYSNNFDLYENAQDEMWVLSSNGIYVVATEELLANGAVSPTYYGRDNGLPVIATANSYSELEDGGNLYISGTTGVAKVNIDVPFESVDNVKMAVPYVAADGVIIYPDETGTIHVPADTGKLTVYPFVYTYSLMNPQVTYKLEGLDDNAATVRRTELSPIDYTNLSGGTYQFVMQLHDSMGHGNKEMSVTVDKQEAIGEMLWFRILSLAVIVAAAVGIVWFYFHRKTLKLQAKEHENRQLVGEITKAFARTIDMKDHYTNGHSSRVANYTAMLTRELGYDEETVERYFNIALLHDIGKIGVPSSVLNTPGRLTDEEFDTIKSHTSLGHRVLKDISIMPELATGAWAHHERPDGKGYPRGLKGDEIPRVAQIIAVADTFDAMYSDRPYRKRMNFDKVVSIISEVSGTQLEPDVVDAFLRLVEKGEFRAPDDTGGGSMEDIDNIHKRQQDEKAAAEAEAEKATSMAEAEETAPKAE